MTFDFSARDLINSEYFESKVINQPHSDNLIGASGYTEVNDLMR